MKKNLLLSLMFCVIGLKASDSQSTTPTAPAKGPKTSPVKVLLKDGKQVQPVPVPLSYEACNDSFSKLNTSPVEPTPVEFTPARRRSMSSSSSSCLTPLGSFVRELENIRSSVERSPELYEALRQKFDKERQEELQKKLINREKAARLNVCDRQSAAFVNIFNTLKTVVAQEKQDELVTARLKAVLELQKLHGYGMDATALCPFTGEMFNTVTGKTVSE